MEREFFCITVYCKTTATAKQSRAARIADQQGQKSEDLIVLRRLNGVQTFLFGPAHLAK